MIEGYKELNENISNTILRINEVANASKEQERGIIQINDAINTLDQATQKMLKLQIKFQLCHQILQVCQTLW